MTHLLRALGTALFALSSVPLVASAALLSGAAEVSGGYDHTCALTASGGVQCWGHNTFGQLGDGTFVDRPAPVDVVGLSSGVVAIDAGEGHTCALTNAGGVKCWGNNEAGQVGDGTNTNRPVPTDVSGLATGVIAISAGSFASCAVTSGGAAKCWGSLTTGDTNTPSDISGLASGVAAIDVGGTHFCAVMAAGGLKCWGSNFGGQLGQGNTTPSPTPLDVPGLTAVAAVSLGFFHSCALTTTGAVQCWGFNTFGQVGDGTMNSRLSPDVVVGLSADVLQISLGHSHSCALLMDFSVRCWGYNAHGELGDGTTTHRTTPTPVSVPSGATAIGAGGLHSCAVTSATNVACWGMNQFGQVGIDTSGNFITVPALVGSRTQQAITFGALANRDIAATPFAVSATATSGLSVVFSTQTPQVCTVSGSTVSLHAIGVCSVVASQPGNTDYASAPEVARSFLVTAGNAPPHRLVNLSTRVSVGTGEAQAIAGFVIQGPAPKTVVVRALGPSLAAFGVANPLANPVLQLLNGNVVIASNDEWATTPQASTLQSIGFAPSDAHESAILVTLNPGAYTALVSGAGNGTGVALVEVYELDRADVALANMSTRGQVLTGNDVMIAGLVVHGDAPQTVVIAGKGPSLAAFGIANPLANPSLILVRSSDQTVLAANDDWGTAPNAAQIQASGFAPSHGQESAILMSLPPGAYTVILSGVSGTTGVGIVEVYSITN